VLPFITKDLRDRAMQVASLRYYWSLAHRDPTCGVQVSHVDIVEWMACTDMCPDSHSPGVLGQSNSR
jgi:hypothetical protein